MPHSKKAVSQQELVVGLIKDRDCLQVGIGAVPAMISNLISDSDLKDLGIHTEMAPALEFTTLVFQCVSFITD